jgi:hypothetical protein
VDESDDTDPEEEDMCAEEEIEVDWWEVVYLYVVHPTSNCFCIILNVNHYLQKFDFVLKLYNMMTI